MSVAVDMIDSPAMPPAAKMPGHVVILTNFIAAHRADMYRAVAQRVERLTVLLSTKTDINHKWPADWKDLNVTMQRTLSFPQVLRHRTGFNDVTYIHLPWDTIPQLRRLRPDVLVSSELGFRSLSAVCHRTLKPRVPLMLWVALSEHTELAKGRLRRLTRKFLLSRADGVLVNGVSGSRYLQKLGCPEEKIHRLNYCCTAGVFDRLPVARDEANTHRMITVGQLIQRKGLVPFLGGLKRWGDRHPDQRAELTIVGSGPLEAELRAFVLPQNVKLNMIGYCSGFERVAEHYGQAGIFAFPTLSDDWGMPVNEAMTAALPVLGSVYSQAVDELCVDGETGWRFRTDHPDEMDRAIERALATSPEQLHRMRAAARRTVTPFTPEHGADQFVAALQATAQAHAARRQGKTNSKD